tara:strand:+ start:850 stop:1119 length:270 start_codon:yes stop_codon:yes gene_type:complete
MINKFYTSSDISKLTGLSKNDVYFKIVNFGVKPCFRKKQKNNVSINYYSLLKVIKTFDLMLFYPVIKKEKKLYFEFSESILKSNVNGTN